MQSFGPSRWAAAGVRAVRAKPATPASPFLQSVFAVRRSFHNSSTLREEKKQEEKNKSPEFNTTLQGSTWARLQRERANDARYIREQEARKKNWVPNSFGVSIGWSLQYPIESLKS